MSFTTSRIQRRTEDAGSAGCPPQAVGCTTNPDEHDLTPAQASSLSQSLASSSAIATSTASVAAADFTRKSTAHGVNMQAVGGIIVIVFLVLAFTSVIGYIAFGAQGERCCCRRKERRKQEAVQVEAQTTELAREVNAEPEAQNVQKD